MKRFYLLLGIAVMIVSCNNNQKSRMDDPTVFEEDVVEVDTHNARNSLDVDGTYTGTLPAGTFKGTLPSASGEGMEVTLTLNDDTYKISTKYVSHPEQTFESSGKFTWDQNGSIITLENEETPNKYFVGENQLYHLDVNGNRITGDLADRYILKKK